jgi:hypothetical protein
VVEGGVEVEGVVVQGAGQGVGLGGREPDGERVRELQAGAQDEPDLPVREGDADVDVADELVAGGIRGQIWSSRSGGTLCSTCAKAPRSCAAATRTGSLGQTFGGCSITCGALLPEPNRP